MTSVSEIDSHYRIAGSCSWVYPSCDQAADAATSMLSYLPHPTGVYLPSPLLVTSATRAWQFWPLRAWQTQPTKGYKAKL